MIPGEVCGHCGAEETFLERVGGYVVCVKCQHRSVDRFLAVRLQGGPGDGMTAAVARKFVVSGLPLPIWNVPAPGDPAAPIEGGVYRCSRSRGYWSAEWEVEGTTSPGDMFARLMDPTVSKGELARLFGAMKPVPGPEWHQEFSRTGQMPVRCDRRSPAVEHDWGPWGSAVIPGRASTGNETRTCNRCGLGTFRLAGSTGSQTLGGGACWACGHPVEAVVHDPKAGDALVCSWCGCRDHKGLSDVVADRGLDEALRIAAADEDDRPPNRPLEEVQ